MKTIVNLFAGLAAMTAACTAHAQAQSLTLFGVLDSGVEYLDNVGANGKGLLRVPTITGSFPSRWGLRGTEDLGGGNRAVMMLESGIAMDGGTLNQGGRLFGLQSWVGLAGRWGQVSIGRQWSMLMWSMLENDVLGPNIYGAGALDSYLPNARTDNAIAYKGRFDSFTVGATYSLGRDTVNAGPSPSGTNCAGELALDRRTCRQWSTLLAYDSDRWGASLAYDTQRGGPGAFGGLVRGGQQDQRRATGGYLRQASTRIGLYWIRRSNDAIPTARSDVFAAGFATELTPSLTFAAQASRLRYRHSFEHATVFAARAMYAFSKRTSVYATAGNIENSGGLALSASGGGPGGNPVAGGKQTGAMVGVRHAF